METVVKIGNDDCPNGFSAPMKGVTPSTQVGRLSGSHSDIGFHLRNSISRKNGDGTERWRSLWKSIVQHCLHVTAENAWLLKVALENVAEERRFRGGIMEPPWKQTGEIGTAWAKVQNCRRYVSRASSTHITGNVQRLRWSLTARIPTATPCWLEKLDKRCKTL